MVISYLLWGPLLSRAHHRRMICFQIVLVLGFNWVTVGYQTCPHGVCSFFSTMDESLMPSALSFSYVGYLKSKFHFYSFLDNRKGSEFLKPLKICFHEVLLFKKKNFSVLAGTFSPVVTIYRLFMGFGLCAARLQGHFWSELGINTENQTVFATS